MLSIQSSLRIQAQNILNKRQFEYLKGKGLKKAEKPEAQVKAISELKDITLKIQDLYGMLPTIVVI
jgi:hypothetical protein